MGIKISVGRKLPCGGLPSALKCLAHGGLPHKASWAENMGSFHSGPKGSIVNKICSSQLPPLSCPVPKGWMLCLLRPTGESNQLLLQVKDSAESFGSCLQGAACW